MSEDLVVITRSNPRALTVTLNRPERRNSLTQGLVQALHRALDEAESDPACRLLILAGRGPFFCTGMDFEEASRTCSSNHPLAGEEYMALLKRFASCGKVVVARVDGTVLAGGVGLVAASDLVVATPESTFGLPEALWGLLPASVMPFLIRRVGFQPAYRMTLTTETITGQEAWRIGLVDRLSDRPDDEIRRFLLRLGRLDPQTVLDVKAYLKPMWLFNETIEQNAIAELGRLMQSERVRTNIRKYTEQGLFPWET